MTKTDGIYIRAAGLDRIGRIAGWAPGNYTGKCGRCDAEMIADKRASQCIVCAVIDLKSRPYPVVPEDVKQLLLRAHGTLKHGAASSISQAMLLLDLEKALGLKDEAELLRDVGEARPC